MHIVNMKSSGRWSGEHCPWLSSLVVAEVFAGEYAFHAILGVLPKKKIAILGMFYDEGRPRGNFFLWKSPRVVANRHEWWTFKVGF